MTEKFITNCSTLAETTANKRVRTKLSKTTTSIIAIADRKRNFKRLFSKSATRTIRPAARLELPEANPRKIVVLGASIALNTVLQKNKY